MVVDGAAGIHDPSASIPVKSQTTNVWSRLLEAGWNVAFVLTTLLQNKLI